MSTWRAKAVGAARVSRATAPNISVGRTALRCVARGGMFGWVGEGFWLGEISTRSVWQSGRVLVDLTASHHAESHSSSMRARGACVARLRDYLTRLAALDWRPCGWNPSVLVGDGYPEDEVASPQVVDNSLRSVRVACHSWTAVTSLSALRSSATVWRASGRTIRAAGRTLACGDALGRSSSAAQD